MRSLDLRLTRRECLISPHSARNTIEPLPSQWYELRSSLQYAFSAELPKDRVRTLTAGWHWGTFLEKRQDYLQRQIALCAQCSTS